MTVSVKPRRVDEKWDEAFRRQVRRKYAFIDKERAKLEKRAGKRGKKADDAEEQLKTMITTDQKIENVLELAKANYVDEHPDGRCCMCKKRWKCRAKQPTAIHNEKGRLLSPAYEVLTTHCSLFEPLQGYGKRDDYPMFTEAHSTTVTVTDTSQSFSVFYSPGFTGNWNIVHDSANGTSTTQNNFAMLYSFSASKYRIYRAGMIFDLSSLPAGASISDARFQLYQYSVYGAGNVYFQIQDGGIYPSGVSVGQYNYTFYSGSYGTTNCQPHTLNAYNDFLFSNYSTINMGGTTRHMMREQTYDIANVPSTGFIGYAYEAPLYAAGNDPKMRITYSEGNPAQRVIWWM